MRLDSGRKLSSLCHEIKCIILLPRNGIYSFSVEGTLNNVHYLHDSWIPQLKSATSHMYMALLDQASEPLVVNKCFLLKLDSCFLPSKKYSRFRASLIAELSLLSSSSWTAMHIWGSLTSWSFGDAMHDDENRRVWRIWILTN